MRKSLLVAAAAAVLVTAACGSSSKSKSAPATTLAPPTTIGSMTPSQVFQATSAQTVELLGKQGNTGVGGSGVILDANNAYVLTAAHVVAGTSSLKVRVGDAPPEPARIVASSPCDDLALVKIVTKPPALHAATFASSATLKNEDRVVALGYPESLSATDSLVSTDGTVQDPKVQLTNLGDYPKLPNVIQHSASINPGNSGGPLYNDRAALVGINVVKSTDLTNQNYSIASDRIQQLLPDLEAGKSSANAGWDIAPNSLSEARSLLSDAGWSSDDLNALTQALQSNGVKTVMVVFGVESGSPAQTAKINAGDIVTSINDTDVTSVADVCDILQSHPGEKLTVRGYYTQSADDGSYFAGDTWRATMTVK